MRRLRKVIDNTMSGKYIEAAEKQMKFGDEVKAALEGPFGACLIKGLKDLEKAALEEIASTSPFRFSKQFQARAELRVARYIMAKLNERITNAEAIRAQLEEMAESDYI